MNWVEIIPTSETHVEGFRAVVDSVARERRYLASVRGFPLVKARAFVARILAGEGVQFLAIDNGQIVGWCDVICGEHEGFRHSGVLGMGLLPGYRHQGLGTRLLERTIGPAAAIGVSRIELEVFESNRDAVRLYARCGFTKEGLKVGARVIDGVSDNIVCMARIL